MTGMSVAYGKLTRVMVSVFGRSDQMSWLLIVCL